MTTPKLSLPVLTEGATNSETTANETFQQIDALLPGRVEDRDLTAPPGSPSDGDLYIVAASATGDWAGQDGNLALWNTGTGWQFFSPVGGMTIFVQDEKELLCYSSQESEWFPAQSRWSTTEHWTGRYGKGGSKIYAKCLEGISVASGGTLVNTAHGITNLDLNKPVKLEGYLHDGTTVYQLSVALSGSIRVYHNIDSTNYVVNPDNLPSAFTCDVRIEYCKT